MYIILTKLRGARKGLCQNPDFNPSVYNIDIMSCILYNKLLYKTIRLWGNLTLFNKCQAAFL